MTVIEVFADVACPFAHVGLRRFVEHRRAIRRDDVVLRVRAWPLEIVNGAALDPALIAEEVSDLRNQVAPDLFARFNESAVPATSMPAFVLAAAAYEQDLVLGEQVSLEVRNRLFESGIDVADAAVLGDVAVMLGVREHGDQSAVERDLRDGIERGVIGSPHFFTPDGDFFCPALGVGRDPGGALRVRPDEQGFNRFLAVCFR